MEKKSKNFWIILSLLLSLLLLLAVFLSFLSFKLISGKSWKHIFCLSCKDIDIKLKFDYVLADSSISVYSELDEPVKIAYFKIYEDDKIQNDLTLFKITTNDTNFGVEKFAVTRISKILNYNVNPLHQYAVSVTACYMKTPTMCGSETILVSLVNDNVNPPMYTKPVVVIADENLSVGSLLTILNAYDLDGDQVTYSMSPDTPVMIKETIGVHGNGTLVLKRSLSNLPKSESSFTFQIDLEDDGSCCKSNPVVKLKSIMNVELKVIRINSHTPVFVENRLGANYCEKTYYADENTLFQIEIQAKDDDKGSENGEFAIFSSLNEYSPQDGFILDTSFAQQGRFRRAIVSNLEPFDYEKPKYGSNKFYIMFYAEDKGARARRGYCYISIEIRDVNDNVPVFNRLKYEFTVYDQYWKSPWIKFLAKDADSGDNGRVEIFMHSKSDQKSKDVFNLATDGVLTTWDTNLLNATMFRFDIYATDLSVNRNWSRVIPVQITVILLRLLPPSFADFINKTVELYNVSEMARHNANLKTFNLIIAYKEDYLKDVFLRCYLQPISLLFEFRYESKGSKSLTTNESCSLIVKEQLSFKTARHIDVYLVAELRGKNDISHLTTREVKRLTINLKEENLSKPKFHYTVINAFVAEGEDDVNKIIAIVYAYDADLTEPFNKVHYDFYRKTNSEGYFGIDANTGEIKLVKPIWDMITYNLVIAARDGAPAYNDKNPHEATIDVHIQIRRFVNKNPPHFTESSYSFDLSEKSKPGFIVGKLHVRDIDFSVDFNFALNDSTFGLRQSTSEFVSPPKTVVELVLNTHVSVNQKNFYNLIGYVNDGRHVSSSNLYIRVTG